jgi:hypothetical protein
VVCYRPLHSAFRIAVGMWGWSGAKGVSAHGARDQGATLFFGKKAAMVLVSAATGMGLLGLAAPAAQADSLTGSQNVVFVDIQGSTWHCKLFWGQNFDQSSSLLDIFANVSKQASSDTGCLTTLGTPEGNTDIEIDSVYKQKSDGRQVTNKSEGLNSVYAEYSGVKNAKMTSTFWFTFRDCNPNVSVCAYSYSLSQGSK